MDALRQWALSLCMAAVAGAIAQILLPEGSLQKVYKITFSIFFLCCLFSPVLADIHFDMLDSRVLTEESAEHAKKLQAQIDSQISESMRVSVEALAREALAELGINSPDISVVINIGEDGSILISKLSVRLGSLDASKSNAAKEKLKNELGIEPDVFLIEE